MTMDHEEEEPTNSLSRTMTHNPYTNTKSEQRRHRDSGSNSNATMSSSTTPNSSISTNAGIKSDTIVPTTKTATATTSASALIISAADKAGMDGIDRRRIDAIILRESGDSAYMLQQKKRDSKVNQRIEAMKRRLQRRTGSNDSNNIDKNHVNIDIDDLLRKHQRHQHSTRSTCLVMDMDMFYMACELLSRPHLKDKPACVGGGMILTSNYVARRYGVRSAMPGFIGDRLVEELSEGKETLIHVPSNFDLYRKKAEIVRNVLREYDPEMKSYSLDEAYLDIGPYLALYLQSGSQWSHEQIKNELMKQKDFTPTDHDDVVTDGIFDDERKADTSQENEDNGDNLQNKVKECKVSASAVHILQAYSSIICIQALERIVQGLRQRVQQATGGLTCSVGVGPNFSIAKIASDRNKPNGQLCVDPSQVLDFIRPLPVRKVPGVGRVTEKILQQVCDIETVQDLYNQRHLVYWLFGCGATAHFLLRASVGCSTSMTSLLDIGVGSTEEQQPGGVSSRSSSSSSTDHQKGISRERTFSPDDSWVNLNMKLEEIARMVYDDLKRKSIVTRTITVKVKLKSFDVLSRAHSLPTGTYIEDAKQLVHVAAQIFAQIRSSYFDKIEDGQSPMKKRRDFVVRLLGIRCSNLIEESEFQTIQAGRLDTFLTTSSNRSSQTSKGGVVSHKYKSPLRTSQNQGAISESTNYETKSTKLETPICDLGRNVGGDETGVNDTTKIAEEGRQKVFCPLCNRGFPFQDNDSLNTHLDTCLSSGVVREVIKEEDSRLTSSESSRKRQRLTDFFEHA